MSNFDFTQFISVKSTESYDVLLGKVKTAFHETSFSIIEKVAIDEVKKDFFADFIEGDFFELEYEKYFDGFVDLGLPFDEWRDFDYPPDLIRDFIDGINALSCDPTITYLRVMLTSFAEKGETDCLLAPAGQDLWTKALFGLSIYAYYDLDDEKRNYPPSNMVIDIKGIKSANKTFRNKRLVSLDCNFNANFLRDILKEVFGVYGIKYELIAHNSAESDYFSDNLLPYTFDFPNFDLFSYMDNWEERDTPPLEIQAFCNAIQWLVYTQDIENVRLFLSHFGKKGCTADSIEFHKSDILNDVLYDFLFKDEIFFDLPHKKINCVIELRREVTLQPNIDEGDYFWEHGNRSRAAEIYCKNMELLAPLQAKRLKFYSERNIIPAEGDWHWERGEYERAEKIYAANIEGLSSLQKSRLECYTSRKNLIKKLYNENIS